MPLMSQREFAQQIGVSPQYVSKLVAQGKIRRVGRQVDSRQARAAIKASTVRPERKSLPRSAAKPSSSRKASPSHSQSRKQSRRPGSQDSQAAPARRSSATRSLYEAKAEREHYQALAAKLDYERSIGKLLPADQVLIAEQQKNAVIRANLRRLARSLAPRIVQATTPIEAERLLLEEIDLVLGELARDPLGMAPAPPVEGEGEPVVSPVVLPVTLPADAAIEARA